MGRNVRFRSTSNRFPEPQHGLRAVFNHDKDDNTLDRRHNWVAVVKFRYTVAGEERMAVRLIHSGFQVTDYRRDQDRLRRREPVMKPFIGAVSRSSSCSRGMRVSARDTRIRYVMPDNNDVIDGQCGARRLHDDRAQPDRNYRNRLGHDTAAGRSSQSAVRASSSSSP